MVEAGNHAFRSTYDGPFSSVGYKRTAVTMKIGIIGTGNMEAGARAVVTAKRGHG
jgi:hypothetical protein